VEELPKDLKKLAKSAKVPDAVFEKDFIILLNVLHFLTKKVFLQTPVTVSNASTQTVSLNSHSRFLKENPKKIFKSLKKNGRGGFGTVYIAKDSTEPAETSKVAVKKTKNETNRQKYDNLSEINYMKLCNHPNIVKFKKAYEYKDECWIIMEFLEGGTLTEARKGHEFEENEIAYVAKELLKGIEYIHSLGLVHRDVKSENIMLSIHGDVKIIDFGLCVDNSFIKRPSMVGSPYWMPPEMIRRKIHSFPADIWSFGVCILELSNKIPPNIQNKVKAMFTVGTVGITQPFDEPEKWSNQFKDFISKCLAFDPNERGTAKDLLKHPFLEQAADTRKVMRNILSEVFLQRVIGLI